MADATHRSTLEILLQDDLSRPAKIMAEAMVTATARAKALDEALAKSGASQKLQESLRRIGASVPQVEGATKALKALAEAQGIAADKSTWTTDQAKNMKSLEAVTVATVRAQMRAEDAQARARQDAVAQQVRQDAAAAEAQARQAQRATLEAERQKRSETEFAISEFRRRAHERERLAETEMREAKRVADAEEREAKRVADFAVREAEREAREIARNRDAEQRAAQRDHERIVAEREHAIVRGGFSHFALGAAAGAVSAHGVISATESTLEAGMDRASALVSARRAGIGQAELDRAVAMAREETRNGVLTTAQAIEIYKESRSAVQNPRDVVALMPDLLKAGSIMKANGAEGSIADLVKAGESLGLMNDPARFHKFLDSQVRAMTVLGHTINPEQIYEAAKYSKSAGATLSDDFLNLSMPSLIQEMHGSSAGDALSALAKRFRGGLAHQHTAVELLRRQGLLEEPGKIVRARGSGEIMGYTGRIKGDDLLTSDPDRWFREVWRPAAAKMGAVTLSDQIALLNKELPQTAANLGRIFLQQEESFRQHRENARNSMGLDDSVAELGKDPKYQIENFKAALTDLQATVTSDAMDALGLNLNKLSGWIRDLEGWAGRNSGVALGIGAATVGAGLAGSGFMAYQVSRGFGLTTSAAALKAAAAAQAEAAAALGRAAGVEMAAAEKQSVAIGGVKGTAGKADVLNIVANSVALFGLAKAAEDAHIFDPTKRGGWKGAVEFLDPGLANHIFGRADADAAPANPVQSDDQEQIADLERQAADTKAKIADIQAKSKNAEAADVLTRPLKDQLQELQNGIATLRDGLPKQAPPVSGGGDPSLLHKSAFFTRDDVPGSMSAEAIIARGTETGFEAAFRNLMATGTVNGRGGGAGLIDASYETADGISVSGGRASALPSLRYGRGANGQYRLTPDGPIDHFTAAGRTFASKSPELMRRMMKDFNLGPEQAAAIMGNLGHESAGFTAFHEGGMAPGAGGIGWAQWTGSRRREYEAWTAANHLDPRSDEANYGFLKHELLGNPRYRAALDRLRASKGTPADMMAFERTYEGAGIKAYGSRWAYDRKALEALQHDPTMLAREPQGPRLPQRAPRTTGDVTASAEPAKLFDHAHLQATEQLLDRIALKVDRMGHVSMSIAHSPRENGRAVQLASRADVGRHARAVPSTSGSSFV